MEKEMQPPLEQVASRVEPHHFPVPPQSDAVSDRAKLAKVIVKLADIEKPAVSFVAGSDAVELPVNAITTSKNTGHPYVGSTEGGVV
jgi:hypothetical protein